jgi:hypothetical protein
MSRGIGRCLWATWAPGFVGVHGLPPGFVGVHDAKPRRTAAGGHFVHGLPPGFVGVHGLPPGFVGVHDAKPRRRAAGGHFVHGLPPGFVGVHGLPELPRATFVGVHGVRRGVTSYADALWLFLSRLGVQQLARGSMSQGQIPPTTGTATSN